MALLVQQRPFEDILSKDPILKSRTLYGDPGRRVATKHLNNSHDTTSSHL